jgi:hypothetical protein
VTRNAILSETAEQNQMTSNLPPMDPAALSWIEHWYPVASKGLLAAASITVIAGITAMGFVLLLWRASNLRDQYSDWRNSVLEQAKKAEAGLARAKADLSEADARLADTQGGGNAYKRTHIGVKGESYPALRLC